MNLLLLPEGTPAHGEVIVRGRQFQHMRDVQRMAVGDSMRVGIVNGLLGSAQIVHWADEHATLHIDCEQPAPPKAKITVLLALPRPKMLKRIVQMLVTLGVNELVLLNSYRVEKSFWSTPWLAEDAIAEQVLLGLEQAGDTVPMTVRLAPRFKPFVEDELPALLADKQGLVAHPRLAAQPIAHLAARQTPRHWLLAIGPEGGFIPYEVDKLVASGLTPVDLGARILRVDTAVAVAVAQLHSVNASLA